MTRQPSNDLPKKPVTVIQLNCNKKEYTIHTLLNKHQHDTDILLLQEPRWGHIGTGIQGNNIKEPIGHSSWIPILSYIAFNLDDHYHKWSLTICDGCFDTLKSSKM